MPRPPSTSSACTRHEEASPEQRTARRPGDVLPGRRAGRAAYCAASAAVASSSSTSVSCSCGRNRARRRWRARCGCHSRRQRLREADDPAFRGCVHRLPPVPVHADDGRDVTIDPHVSSSSASSRRDTMSNTDEQVRLEHVRQSSIRHATSSPSQRSSPAFSDEDVDVARRLDERAPEAASTRPPAAPTADLAATASPPPGPCDRRRPPRRRRCQAQRDARPIPRDAR